MDVHFLALSSGSSLSRDALGQSKNMSRVMLSLCFLASIHSSFRTLSLLPIRPLRGHAILAPDSGDILLSAESRISRTPSHINRLLPPLFFPFLLCVLSFSSFLFP